MYCFLEWPEKGISKKIFVYLLQRNVWPPSQTVLRIWDCLFHEGTKIIFRVVLTLIKRNEEKLLACKNFPEIVNTCKALTKDGMVVNCHEFMQVRRETSLNIHVYMYMRLLTKKVLFPVQRMAVIVASQAATIFFFNFFFVW